MYLFVYLSVHLQAGKPSCSARLPSNFKVERWKPKFFSETSFTFGRWVTTSKTQQICDTSKNRRCQHQKTKQFCETCVNKDSSGHRSSSLASSSLKTTKSYQIKKSKNSNKENKKNTQTKIERVTWGWDFYRMWRRENKSIYWIVRGMLPHATTVRCDVTGSIFSSVFLFMFVFFSSKYWARNQALSA